MSSYDFYWSQEWAIKHEKALNKPKRYDSDDDVAIKELFDQLDENHSKTLEYRELIKMMKRLHINPVKSSLPEFFGFIGGYGKDSITFDEFRDIVTSNRYRHRLYDEKESVGSYNELIEFVNSLRRYNLKVNLISAEDVRESVDIYKQLFVLPNYYHELYSNNKETESGPTTTTSTTDVWSKLRIAIKDLHKTNERIKHMSMNKMKFKRNNNNNNTTTTMKMKIEEKEIDRTVSLPSINREQINKKKRRMRIEIDNIKEKENNKLESPSNMKRIKKRKRKTKDRSRKSVSLEPSLIHKTVREYNLENGVSIEVKKKNVVYM